MQRQCLLFATRQLEDGCSVSHCNIEEGSTLQLEPQLRAAIPVAVETPTGTITLEVQPSATIESVK